MLVLRVIWTRSNPFPSTQAQRIRVRRQPFSSTGKRERGRDFPLVPLWIKGERVTTSSGGTVFTKNSKTGKESCEVVVAGEEEVDSAIRESRRAFDEWRDKTGWERKAVLSKVVDLLPDRFGALTEALRADAAFSEIVVQGDRKSALHLTDGAALTAASIKGSVPQTVDGSFAITTREPFGPALSIPAFNYPLTLALRSIVYPLACGNSVIVKSSPLIPQLYHLLGPLFRDAGLPAGTLQILNFSEKDVAARVEQMISDDDVRMINFTGSVRLGKILAAKCGEHLKPSVMELGGKSVAIVLPSADLKLAANNILFGAFLNSGQICMSTEQVLVHQDIAAEFEKVLRTTADEAGWNGGMQLVRPGAGDAAKELADDAVDSGAQVLFSATSPTASPSSSSSSASSYPPTIISSLPDTASLSTTESFSPILTLHSFPSTSSILSHANSHKTGLTASVFSNDLSQALNVAKKLETGAVHINGMTIHDQANLPHGGWKESGWGRFNGKGAIESFTQSKNIRVILPGKENMLPLHAIY
ncbi:hypothetical protein I317_07869 [Kwoniella heveanensis CBS 569]|nr:hypothetical protein I317_07869 [Kwoniella heveanensis CBS 569]